MTEKLILKKIIPDAKTNDVLVSKINDDGRWRIPLIGVVNKDFEDSRGIVFFDCNSRSYAILYSGLKTQHFDEKFDQIQPFLDFLLEKDLKLFMLEYRWDSKLLSKFFGGEYYEEDEED